MRLESAGHTVRQAVLRVPHPRVSMEEEQARADFTHTRGARRSARVEPDSPLRTSTRCSWRAASAAARARCATRGSS